MRDEKYILKIIVVFVLLIVLAFQENKAQVSPSPTPKSKSKVYSSIRKVNFKNFTYTHPLDASEIISIKNGKKEETEEENGANLWKIEYGDVTNDRREEAMIVIQPLTGKNCSCDMVFIYSLENKKPKLLWSFDTWDRANGGFKRVYSEKRNLAVETFGDNKFENGEWEFRTPEGKFNGLCCPTTYTKIVFKWNGERFVPFGERQVFDYDWKKD